MKTYTKIPTERKLAGPSLFGPAKCPGISNITWPDQNISFFFGRDNFKNHFILINLKLNNYVLKFNN